MTLGYSQVVKDKKTKAVLYVTNFKEKILLSESMPLGELWKGEDKDGWHVDIYPKGHSIREDGADRWRPGLDIHHVYNNRTPQRECFLINKCIWVQRISIFTTKKIDDDNETQAAPERVVMVDGRPLPVEKLRALAINDGFDSVEHFFTWFNKDFSGKIIHWTKLKY